MRIANHIAYRQIFEGYPITSLDERCTQLVQRVASLVGGMHLLALNDSQRLSVALAAFFLTRKRTLDTTQLSLCQSVVFWVLNFVTFGCGNERRDTHINTLVASGFGRFGLVFHFTSKAGIPLSRFVDNSNGLNVAFHQSVPANADTSNTEQLQPSSVQLRTHTQLWEIETVKPDTVLKARVARRFTCLDTAKESFKGFTQVNRYRLQSLREDGFGLREGLAIQTRLLHLVVLTDAAAFQFVRPLPIFQAHIIEVSADRKRIEHALFLCRRGVETVFEGFEHRTIIPDFSLALDSHHTRFHPRAKAQGFPAPESYKVFANLNNRKCLFTPQKLSNKGTSLLKISLHKIARSLY